MKKNAPIEWEEVQKETGQPMLTWFLHGMERGDQVEMTPRRSLLLTERGKHECQEEPDHTAVASSEP